MRLMTAKANTDDTATPGVVCGFFARAQEVVRAQSVHVGPFVCAYGKTQGQVLAWMDADEMEFKDIPRPGCTIFIR